VRLLFINKKTAEDRTLIRFIDEGMYDLCVDRGDEVTQVTDEAEFERIREPNTKIIMRVVLNQEANRKDMDDMMIFNTYTCPRCKKKTKVGQGSIIDWCVLALFDYDLCC